MDNSLLDFVPSLCESDSDESESRSLPPIGHNSWISSRIPRKSTKLLSSSPVSHSPVFSMVLSPIRHSTISSILSTISTHHNPISRTQEAAKNLAAISKKDHKKKKVPRLCLFCGSFQTNLQHRSTLKHKNEDCPTRCPNG